MLQSTANIHYLYGKQLKLPCEVLQHAAHTLKLPLLCLRHAFLFDSAILYQVQAKRRWRPPDATMGRCQVAGSGQKGARCCPGMRTTAST